jgi:putative RNA 2'-phosphotransferase
MTVHEHKIKRNAKFLNYVLGRHPDEFGLVLDEQGFVKIKTLIKALHEESDWRFFRESHLKELTLSLHPAPVEIDGNRVRSTVRSGIPSISPISQLPKLIYTAIRRRAYPRVLENGLGPGGQGHILLTQDKETAHRLGRRIDNQPVILSIHTHNAQTNGVHFHAYGQALYLADFLPIGTFSGPPLPKENERPEKPSKPVAQAQPTPSAAGSYFPDVSALADSDPTVKRRHKAKDKQRKKERRQARMQKQKDRSWSG